MPAPTPIQIQYGDPMLLGQLALMAGGAQAEDRQRQRDAQLVRQNLAQREKRRRLNDRLAARTRDIQYQPQGPGPVQTFRNQRDQIKKAQEAKKTQSSTKDVQKDAPLSKAVRRAITGQQEPQGYVNINAPEETFTMEDGQITGYRDGEEIPQKELLEERSSYVFPQPDEDEVDPMREAKRAFAQSMGAGNLNQSQQQALQQLVANPDVDLSNFRMAMSKALQSAEQDVEEVQGGPGALSPRQRAQMQVHTLGRKQEKLQKQVQEAAQPFTPEEQEMTISEYEQHIQEQTGDKSWFPFSRGGGLTEDEADQRTKQFRQFKERQDDFETTRRRRNRMIGLADTESDDGEGIPTISSVEEYNAVPSGSRYRDPQGTIRRKP